MGQNLISTVAILLDSNFLFSTTTTNHKAFDETAKYGLFRGNTKLTEIGSEKNLMADLLDKDFKTAILRMLREVTDDVKKDKENNV